jgi:hypothetical protein
VRWACRTGRCACLDFAGRDAAAAPEPALQVLGIIGRLVPQRYFDIPAGREEWLAIRQTLVGEHPGSLHSLDSPIGTQHEDEARLLAGSLSPLELHFGRARK